MSITFGANADTLTKLNSVAAVLNSSIVSIVSRALSSLLMVSVPSSSSCRDEYEFERFATGFAIDRNTVVSVAHLKPGDHVCLIDANGEPSEGRVRGIDSRWDILFIESDRALVPLSLKLETPPIGSIVLACGMPHGLLKPFFSIGIVSGYKTNAAIGDEYIEGLMTASTPVISGMSGGPLIDIYGKVIGIIVGNAFGSNEFALIVPSKRVYYSYSILKKYGRVDHIKLGIRVIEFGSKSIKNVEGLAISSISNSRLISSCGISVGDVVVAVEGFKVKSIEDLWEVLDSVLLSAKDRIIIEFYSYTEKTYKVCEYMLYPSAENYLSKPIQVTRET